MKKAIRKIVGALCCFLKGYNLYNYNFNFKEPSVGDTKTCAKKDNHLSLVNDRINLACRFYLTSKYYKLKEKERRDFIGSRIWGAHAGKNWHTKIEKIYISHDRFIEDRKNLIDSIGSLKVDDYGRIIEIGAGNGWFLDILSKRIKDNIEFIGLDLNSETVETARSRYKDNTCIRFICSDMREFTRTSDIKKSIIVSCFVLEYFSSQELIDFYNLLKNNAPCYLAMIERVSVKHKDKGETIPIGDFSYSHDYEKIFEGFGMKKLYSYREDIEDDASYFNLTALFKI